MAVYILYPSIQNLRPTEFPRDNLLTDGIRLLYAFDTNTGVCPSLHCAYSIGIASVWLKQKHAAAAWKVFACPRCLSNSIPRWIFLPRCPFACWRKSLCSKFFTGIKPAYDYTFSSRGRLGCVKIKAKPSDFSQMVSLLYIAWMAVWIFVYFSSHACAFLGGKICKLK